MLAFVNLCLALASANISMHLALVYGNISVWFSGFALASASISVFFAV